MVLSALGRDGFEFASDAAAIGGAFQAIRARIGRIASSFYLTQYCSPRRAGTHQLRVAVSDGARTTSLVIPYDAAGFGPGCTLDALPPRSAVCE